MTVGILLLLNYWTCEFTWFPILRMFFFYDIHNYDPIVVLDYQIKTWPKHKKGPDLYYKISDQNRSPPTGSTLSILFVRYTPYWISWSHCRRVSFWLPLWWVTCIEFTAISQRLSSRPDVPLRCPSEVDYTPFWESNNLNGLKTHYLRIGGLRWTGTGTHFRHHRPQGHCVIIFRPGLLETQNGEIWRYWE